jgi:hypothetical protein
MPTLPRRRADLVVVQLAAGNAVDAHDEATGRVRAGDAAVGLHPVGGVVAALFGGQQGQGRLERVDAEILAFGQRELAAAQIETVAHRHVTGTIAFDGFHGNLEVVEFKMGVVPGLLWGLRCRHFSIFRGYLCSVVIFVADSGSTWVAGVARHYSLSGCGAEIDLRKMPQTP